jgi:hypothetical protein
VGIPLRTLGFAIWCCEQELQGRIDGKRPGEVRPFIAEHLRALQLEFAVAHERQAQVDRGSPCTNEGKWISTREAAAILGLSPRTVQRRAADFEGWWLSPRKVVFRESVVREYAEALNGARDSAGPPRAAFRID